MQYSCPFLVVVFFFNNVIYFIQMLATINTPKVQAPFGVSLLHPVLIIQGYNKNYMKYIQSKYNFYLITFWKHLFIFHLVYNILLSLKMYTFECFIFIYSFNIFIGKYFININILCFLFRYIIRFVDGKPYNCYQTI